MTTPYQTDFEADNIITDTTPLPQNSSPDFVEYEEDIFYDETIDVHDAYRISTKILADDWNDSENDHWDML